ncbi:MAG: DNA double-strand break repair protein Mre11, partial [Halobacteriales archaeon]|nr:DNA double-strand break repair protein Mre11 [Halobacteriales archaeon]
MTRVIHTGDTHLGYRQYHSPERRADFLTAFRAVAEDALAGDVDAVVHAGDLFHDRRPDLGDVYGAIDVLRDLRDGGVPFLAVVGNHERTADHQWLDLFEALGLADRLGPEPTVINDVAFYGLDFVPRARRPDLTYDFAPHDSTHAALVSHGLFTPFNSDWDLSMVLEAAPVDFDVVLLGDDHHPDTAQVNDTWVTYCGSTERVSAAEREDRGYNIVEFEPNEDVAIRRRGIETRNFVILDLELGPGEGTSRITERLGQEPLEDAVVVVGIDGEGAAVAPAEIESFARERGALVARVNDRREFETAEAGTVEFADPEVAVAERLHEMAPSGAALRIDELVRTEDIPDSNLRGRVKTAVEELLEEDPNAFEPGTGEPPTPEPAESLDQPDTGPEDTAEP